MSVRVLLGDSSPSNLPPTILDILVEVSLYARDVSIAHEETTELWRQLDAAELSFSEIAEQLQRFRRVGESGLLASVKDASRDEMKEHGQQAADALGRQVDGWLGQYKSARDKQVGELRRKIDALHQQMMASLDRFALPLRGQPTERTVVRKLEEGKARYVDTASLHLLPGLRTELQLEDGEPEQPRKVRSMLGKGKTLQVGTKKALLRRTKEPAHVSLDDLLVLGAEIGPDSIRLELGKKAAGPVTLRLGLGTSGETLVGRGELPDGSGNQLPAEDQETMRALWDALQGEAERIVKSPARSLNYTLRDEPVETPAGFVNVAERILQEYRPTIRTIMEHSPNAEELTIKVEFGDRREEKWIERRTLAEHLEQVPDKFVQRLSVPEVVERAALPSAPTVRQLPEAGAIPETELEDTATRAYTAVPADLRPENTEDISLDEVEIAGEIRTDTPPKPPGLPSVRKPPPPKGSSRPGRSKDS